MHGSGLPAHGGADVVEVLEHNAGDTDFESVANAHRALIDQIIEEDEDLLAQYLEDGADPSVADLHAPFEKALRRSPHRFYSPQRKQVRA